MWLYRRRRRVGINSKVRCGGAHPLYGALSRRGLSSIKLAYNPCRPDGRLKFTCIASVFSRLNLAVRQQGLPQRRTRRFFSSCDPSPVLDAYSTVYTGRGMAGWVGFMACHFVSQSILSNSSICIVMQHINSDSLRKLLKMELYAS